MLISAGVLVSDCHEAVIYTEGDEYRCMKCMKPCKSAGTIGEASDRKTAKVREHQRLEDLVIQAAKEWELTIVQDAEAFIGGENNLRQAVKDLLEFERRGVQA